MAIRHDTTGVLLVDEHEAARLVGLSASTLRRDRARGSLGIPFVSIGAAVRYSPEAIREWIQARLAPSPAAQSEGNASALAPRRRGRPSKKEQIERLRVEHATKRGAA